MKTLKELLIHELEVLYDSEGQLLQAIPELRDSAHEQSLKKIFDQLLTETQAQRERLEVIYKRLGIQIKGIPSQVMRGMIGEIRAWLREEDTDEVHDARLIDAAKRIAYYEIAGYSSCVRYAKELQHIETARKLQETLDEEYAINSMLDEVAENTISGQVA